MSPSPLLSLLPIAEDGSMAITVDGASQTLEALLLLTVNLYRSAGFRAPWISYLAVESGVAVGLCSFIAAPAEGRVEIAYIAFPEHQGRGVATAMARALVAIASAADRAVVVTARTLADRNASHRVLEKLDFVPVGREENPDDGPLLVWRQSA